MDVRWRESTKRTAKKVEKVLDFQNKRDYNMDVRWRESTKRKTKKLKKRVAFLGKRVYNIDEDKEGDK